MFHLITNSKSILRRIFLSILVMRIIKQFYSIAVTSVQLLEFYYNALTKGWYLSLDYLTVFTCHTWGGLVPMFVPVSTLSLMGFTAATV